MNVLVLLHTEPDGGLSRASLEAVGAAAALGSVSVGLVGETVSSAAALVPGPEFAVEGAEFRVGRYATDAAAAEALCRAVGAELIVAPGTSRWMRVLPGVAQRIGAKVDSHVVALGVDGGAVVARRWVYRNRMEAAVTRPVPWMVLLDGGAAAAWSGAGASSVTRVAVSLGEVRTSVLRVEAPQADQATIRPDARLLMVAGAGWTKKQKDGQAHTAEAAELISDLLKLTQASLGSSKSLVDIGSEGEPVLPFLTHSHQVGQTGSSPRHPKGLATCCHGEEPHVVGWRFVNERRAVNLDANCGWARKKADVLYVADAFEVAREMRKLLGASAAGV
jgi:electron transfer flavoprotein alpha subunit